MHGSFDHHETGSKWALAATVLSIGVALVLIATKLIAWQLSGSTAILGSLADSALDLIGSGLAFIGVRWAAEPADAEHRFGHHKAEAITGLAQAILITGSALFVLNESIMRLVTPAPLAAGNLAIWVMLLSLVLSTGLVAFQTYALRQSGSIAVEGDRAHYTGDLIANAGALLAIFLSLHFGWLRADAIAGILAAVFLGWSALSISRRVLPQLMDEELSTPERERISQIVMADGDVLGFHHLRTRRAGRRIYIQLHLELRPDIQLRHAHEISERVEAQLHGTFPGADILLHQDPHGEADDHDAPEIPTTA
ncbi:cation diffusion facilitator family transporter [Parvularcula sp. IMCC14364]|uniref:cation diffusion facilitator family transporter n=1 Tax=Parvularcula sp. IMCC14364 TaxID=3067902 RepID=UPI0027424BE2|nr:cation diffusion facilitator family transporter [Parvularcula sp. IMCC14364]